MNTVLIEKNQPIIHNNIGNYQGCTSFATIGNLGVPQFEMSLNGQQATQSGTGAIAILNPDIPQVIEVIADKAEVTKKDAEVILAATLETIVESVSEGEKVSLVGFGSFEKRHRKAREGRNPQTGKTMTIAATDVPAFSAGKSFKESVAS